MSAPLDDYPQGSEPSDFPSPPPAKWECDHGRQEIRVKQNSAGRPMYGNQCLQCGNLIGTWIKKAAVVNREQCQPWDESILEARAAYFREANELSRLAAEAVDRRKEEEQAEWWAIYSEYLCSPQWRAKSRAVIKRDGMCRACNARPPTEAHHLTYVHAFNEPLFDLVGVCHGCHEKLTAMDRERRGLLGIEIARAWRASRS